MTTAALVTVPISKAFTDASNRLLGFYQTAFVFIGAYVVYKSLFEKKPLETAIESRKTHIRNGGDEQWQNLTKDEKIAELYSRVIDILAQCEHQAGNRTQSQDHTGSPENAGHSTPDTDHGCCTGLCPHSILSILRSAGSRAPKSAAAVNETTPLNVSTHSDIDVKN